MVLDWKHLVEPIPGESAVGNDLVATGDKEWAQLDEELKARVAHDIEQFEIRHRPQPSVGEGEAPPPLSQNQKPANPQQLLSWVELLTKLEKMLTTRCKHVGLGSQWMVAALFYDGISGLRKGLQLNRALISQYWDTIHPRLEQPLARGDKDPRAAVMRRAANLLKIKDWLNLAPMVPGSSQPCPSYSQMSRSGSNNTEEEKLRAIIQEGPIEKVKELREELGLAQKELLDLMEDLQARCEEADPPTVSSDWKDLLEILSGRQKFLDSLAPSGLAGSQAAGDDSSGSRVAAAAPSMGPPQVTVAASREDAFRQLRNLAMFFAKSEPHSPLSAALQELAKWEKLSFAVLMKRLIEDSAALERLYIRTGVEPEGGAVEKTS